MSWKSVVSELHQRRTSELRRYVRHSSIGEYIQILDASFAEELTDQEVEDSIFQLLTSAVSDPQLYLRCLLLCYVTVLERWELTNRWSVLQRVCDAVVLFHNRSAGHYSDVTKNQLRSIDSISKLLRGLRYAFRIENGFSCSSAKAALESASTGLMILKHRPGQELKIRPCRSIQDCVLQASKTLAAYFTGVQSAARAVLAFRNNFEDSDEVLAAACERLTELLTLSPLRFDTLGTELNAQRVVLEEMRRRLSSPRLTIHSGRLIFCYPFPLPFNVSTSGADKIRSDLLQNNHFRNAEVRVAWPSDMWSYKTRWEKFGGFNIDLPGLSLLTLEGEDYLGRVQIRVNVLGVHYLRVAFDLADTDVHEVYQWLRRGSTAAGSEQLRCDDWNFERMCDFADGVVREFCLAVRAGVGPGSGAFPAGPPPSEGVHTVLSMIRFAGTSPGKTVTELSAGDRIMDDELLGSALLQQPVRTSTTALDEWIRYPPANVGNALDTRAFRGDTILRTLNTTVISTPSTPSFRVDVYQEAAEFVACLPRLFVQWADEVENETQVLKESLQLAEHNGEADVAVASAAAMQVVEDRQLSIRLAISEQRARLAFLHSSTIVRYPIYRALLDSLWELAEVDRQERDVIDRLTEAEGLFERVSSLSNARRDRTEKQARRRIDLLLTLVAATSVADVIDLANGIGRTPSWLIAVEVFGVILLTVTAGRFLVYSVGVRPSANDRRPRLDRGPGGKLLSRARRWRQ